MMISPTMTYPFGALVRFDATFTRPPTVAEVVDGLAGSDGLTWQPIDPDAVSLLVRHPDATIDTYVFGTDVEIVRDDVGVFHADVPNAASVAGSWSYRWQSTGDGQAAAEGRYNVATSVFP